MLVAQAVRASEIFINTKYPEGTTEKIYEKIFKEKQSIVLIGMPSSGKSTVGRILAKRLGRTFFDTDVLIEENEGMSIPEIFERYGEKGFRDIECAAVRAVADKTSAVIATGGGVILKKENLDALRENGKLIFIDRPLSQLIPTPDRPLSSTPEAVTKRYNERIDIYKSSANIIIDADCDEYCVADRICEALML
jgi:shikimate dehydrogenase